MRYGFLAVVMATVGMVTPSLGGEESSAGMQPSSSMHSFEECTKLVWIRGIHNERDELSDWNAQCLNGQIPFGDDFAYFYKHNPKMPESSNHG